LNVKRNGGFVYVESPTRSTSRSSCVRNLQGKVMILKIAVLLLHSTRETAAALNLAGVGKAVDEKRTVGSTPWKQPFKLGRDCKQLGNLTERIETGAATKLPAYREC
jgi:hypothetical protein